MATPIIMPRQGQSVESCILTEWKVQVGDVVSEGDVLAVIETDKASFDLESTASGTVLELFWEPDDDVPVLANVAAVGEEGEGAEEFRPSGAVSTPVGEPTPSQIEETISAPSVEPTAEIPTVSSSPTPAGAGISPRARKLALRQGIDPETLAGTGPEGRVIERDVEAFLSGQPRLSATARALASEEGLEPPGRGSGLAGMALAGDMRQPGAVEGAEVEPVKGIRKVIGERMIQSLHSTAQLTLHASFELTAAQDYRKKRVQDGLSKVSLNDLIAHAVIETLKEHPEMNAHFLGERIATFEKVHLGVAVDTPRGLMVPVIRDSSDLSIEALSSEIKKLAGACREGTISPDDLAGGSFTLTNLGMLGVETFTPVLNAPEVAILGVGGIMLRPKRRADDEVTFADFLPLSLTIDHQAVDGAPAARFLESLVHHLENDPGQPFSKPTE
ncbi:MAG TPA: 2-oxo acid dehydrogenase subunit E2 [Opitutae bacterium]|nr:2-oxo acid dehydrogenase subunit E2 [Opitutae bacterium]|tara:strand:- start:97 stop:1431 length:1335 start_codon:yes stop_codon:yes gene_type:complete